MDLHIATVTHHFLKFVHCRLSRIIKRTDICEMIGSLAASNRMGEQNADFDYTYNVTYRPVSNPARPISGSFRENQAEFEGLSGKVVAHLLS